MDEIVVLEAGRVAERGTHAELLRRGGRYAESWTRRAEHAVGPGLVEQDERDEDGGGDGHDLQRVGA